MSEHSTNAKPDIQGTVGVAGGMHQGLGSAVPMDAPGNSVPMDAPGNSTVVQVTPGRLPAPVAIEAPDTPESEIAFYSAHAVAIGVVTCTAATPHPVSEYPYIKTTVSLTTERAISGAMPTSVELLGGELPGNRLEVSDQPKLIVGARYLAFVWSHHDGSPNLVAAMPMIDNDTFKIITTTRTIETAFPGETGR